MYHTVGLICIAASWMDDSLIMLDQMDPDADATNVLEEGKDLLLELEQRMSLLRLNNNQANVIDEVLTADVDDELTLDQPLMEMNHENMIILPASPIPGRLSGWINDNHESYNHMSQSNGHQYDSDNINLDANVSRLLSDVRNTITSNITNGKGSLSDYYNIFDRDKNMFFNAEDFMNGCAVLLKASIPLYLASFAITSMAVDGENTVSYGEFKIFILYWETNEAVARKTIDVICKSIEKQGLDYINFIRNLFNEKSENDSGFCSLEAFTSTMKILGVASDEDINKLVMRFDIHGTKSCSVTRFLAMLERSARYKQAVREVTVINQAISESQQLKTMIADQLPLPAPLHNMSTQLIDMCVYLGIRVMTDVDIVWIAEDALRAPLPGLEWTVKHDNAGRIFFHNTLTNESKWDHPLDYHFRKLRDKYRKDDVVSDETSNALLADYANINEQFLQGYRSSMANKSGNATASNNSLKVNFKLPKIINKLKSKIVDEQFNTPRLHVHETHELKAGKEPLPIRHYEGDEMNMCHAYTKGTIGDPTLKLDEHELEKQPIRVQTKLKKKITDKIYRRTEFGILNVFRKAKYGQLKFLPPQKKKEVGHKDGGEAVVAKLLQVEEPPGYMGQRDDVRSYRPSADELLTPKEQYMNRLTRLMYDDKLVQLLGNSRNNN